VSDAPRKPIVWIVDDSSLERAAAKRALAAEYDFEEFVDGTEVVERLASTTSPPNLLLLDWVMPNMSGDEVCRFVRTHDRLGELPIILFTASRIETEHIVQGLSLGANDYVPKPFAPEELRARVLAVLRTKEHRDAAARERTRLSAINRLGRALFEAGSNIPEILDKLLASLHGLVADGCAIILLPGELPPITAAIHGSDPSANDLAAIATLADPMTYAFQNSDDARVKLPPLYHPYIDRYGLRGLAILPFPVRGPVQGVVTLTRDGRSQPFDRDDLAAIETCIEYASLAVQNAMRFETERVARARLDAVLHHAPIGIVVADAEGRIELVNSSATRLVDGIDRVDSLEAVYALGAWASEDGTPIPREAWGLDRQRSSSIRSRVLFTAPGGKQRVLSMTTVTRQEVDQLAGSVPSRRRRSSVNASRRSRSRCSGSSATTCATRSVRS
jgi:DNA-binding response OmpR family regulator